MRNSIRKIIRQTEAILVSVLLLFATSGFAFGQQQSLAAQQDNSVQSLGIPGGDGRLPGATAEIAQGMLLDSGSNANRQLETDALDLLQKFFIGALDTDESHDIEAIAKLKRELIFLDLERQKAVLQNEISQLANERQSGNTDQFEKLLAEVELLKAKLAEQQNQENSSGGDNSLPTVIEIAGSLEVMEALIFVPKSGIVTARVGSILPNGMVVESIKAAGVEVRSGSKRYTLSLGGGMVEFPAVPEPTANLDEFNN